MKVPLAVTVAAKHPGRYEGTARAKAAEWQLPYFERPLKFSLAKLLEVHAEAAFVLGGDGWTFHGPHGAMQFSPGLAHVRIERLRTGVQQPDQLLQVSELREGDTVLDCTLGLGVDAQVCAYVVGARGRVVGLEASRPLALFVAEGLRSLGSSIEVRHTRALEFLRTQPAASFDVVFFDPMFGRPVKSSAAFEVLRRYAVHEPLDEETLQEARRVARRCVVIKTAHRDTSLNALGLRATPLTRMATFAWARVAPLQGN